MKSLTLITFSNLKMLSMKFNFTYLWSLAALLMCCTSCSDSDPAPTPEEDENGISDRNIGKREALGIRR